MSSSSMPLLFALPLPLVLACSANLIPTAPADQNPSCFGGCACIQTAVECTASGCFVGTALIQDGGSAFSCSEVAEDASGAKD